MPRFRKPLPPSLHGRLFGESCRLSNLEVRLKIASHVDSLYITRAEAAKTCKSIAEQLIEIRRELDSLVTLAGELNAVAFRARSVMADADRELSVRLTEDLRRFRN